MALMADTLPPQLQHLQRGVFPLGARVLLTVGVIIKPDSSKNTRLAPLDVAFFYTWELLLLPPFDLGFVPLAGEFLWLLAGPSETFLDNLAYMVRVELYVEVSLDKFGYTYGCPEVVGPAMGGGAFKQKPFEFSMVGSGQTATPARMWFGFKSFES